jgi:hypothetical protein
VSMKDTTRTEHSGAKNGTSSFYGGRAEAKTYTKKLRRANGKKQIRNQLREVANV